MNAGVSTAPCGVSNVPRRADPSARSRSNPKWLTSDDRHRVPIREEAILTLDGFAVRAHDEIVSGERGDQHDQRRTRGMKVRDQVVDDPEPVARPDEEPCVTFARADATGIGRRALERANARRPPRPDVASPVVRL